MCPFHIQEVSVFLSFWESKRSVSVISAAIQSLLMSLRHFRIQVEVAVTSCCNWRHCKTISTDKYHRLSISHEEEAQTNGHQAVFCLFHRWFKTQNHTHFRPFPVPFCTQAVGFEFFRIHYTETTERTLLVWKVQLRFEKCPCISLGGNCYLCELILKTA